MSIASSVRRALVPIHREGYPFIAGTCAAAVAAGCWLEPLGWMLAVVAAWVCYFFRDPPRTTPVADRFVVSPADGRVSYVGPAVPPPELGLGTAPMIRVSVFMSVFDVHVNRAPVSGRITRTAYTPGRFINAELDKASEHNERNALVIDTGRMRVGVVQIAGLIARRIVDWVDEGDALRAGQRFGLIRFGSRLDVYLPTGTSILVAVGQVAVAGETSIADLFEEAAPDVRAHITT